MEVMNLHLETMLWAYVQDSHADWANWLDILQFTYNNSFQFAHKNRPAELLLGFKPHSLLDFLKEHGGRACSEPLGVLRRVTRGEREREKEK